MYLKYKVTFKSTCMPTHEHAIFVDHTCMAPAVSLALPTSHIQHLLGGPDCASAETALCAVRLLRLTRLIISRVEFHRVELGSS